MSARVQGGWGGSGFGSVTPCGHVVRVYPGGWLRLALGTLLSAVACAHLGFAGDSESRFRVGFTSSMFTDINENDAKASVRAWAQTVAKERNIPTDPDTMIFKDVPALLHAVQSRSVDAVGLNLSEYAILRRVARCEPIFLTYAGQRATEQYLLLTHVDSGINTLADLRGRSLSFQLFVRACLSQPWLDTLLVQNGFKPAAQFAGKVITNPKLSKTVLPVFFRQCDACVATRTGFETMVELNPQLGKQLKVIAKSPEVVPAVFCFRADYAPPFREALLQGMRELHQTPAGQQVLTVFQSDRIEEQPESTLTSALELVATYEKLCGPSGGSLPVAATEGGNANQAGPVPSSPRKEGSGL